MSGYAFLNFLSSLVYAATEGILRARELLRWECSKEIRILWCAARAATTHASSWALSAGLSRTSYGVM